MQVPKEILYRDQQIVQRLTKMQSNAMEQSLQLQHSCIDSPEAFTESYCGGPHRRATAEAACKILESVRSSGVGVSKRAMERGVGLCEMKVWVLAKDRKLEHRSAAALAAALGGGKKDGGNKVDWDRGEKGYSRSRV